MTNYVRDLTSTITCYRESAERCANQLRTAATISGGVIRWNSNGSVPPEECIDLAVHIGLPVDVAACTQARREELVAFIDAYRKNQPKRPSAEERASARAAHGPGVVLVDVISGRKFTT